MQKNSHFCREKHLYYFFIEKAMFALIVHVYINSFSLSVQ